MNRFKLVESVDVGNTLGECVLWDDLHERIWWTDIHEAKLYEYVYSSKKTVVHSMPERLASFGLTEDENKLVCAFESGFAIFDLKSQEVNWLDRPERDAKCHRFNDGRVDRQGRFWAGTMVEKACEMHTEKGSLYCLAGTQCRKVLSGITIPNSLCWSPDSREFYFADSKSHCIRRYQFDEESGEPVNPAPFAETNAPFEPDGSAIDSEGYLWNALWGGGKVVRYAPNGEAVDEIDLPVSQPTCVAFGGKSMNLLLVSTAREGLTAEQLQKQPQAGNLLIYRTCYIGLPESRFRL